MRPAAERGEIVAPRAASAAVAPAHRPAQALPLVLALAAFAFGAVRLAADGWRPAALWGIGLALGLTLYHASFGFAGAYRRMFVARDMRGVQAQLLMLALATLLFAPVLAGGSAFGEPVGGAWAPVGASVAAGALLFGIGMQIAGGCGSGTLYTAGGGNARMLIVLGAACVGSFWASLHMTWWQALPAHDAIVLGEVIGWPAATAMQLAFIGALALWLRHAARPMTRPAGAPRGFAALWSGPWPIGVAALLLALGNLGTLLVAGHPWSITWGFTLWGAKGAQALGWDWLASSFWQGGFQRAALAGGVLDDTTSMMDLAIMLGALGAAALAGRVAPVWRIPRASLAAALLGGLAIGYGARISYGCNIGAFFSGVASGSLHGWLWIAAALPGSWIGIRLRRRFGLPD